MYFIYLFVEENGILLDEKSIKRTRRSLFKWHAQLAVAEQLLSDPANPHKTSILHL